MITASFQEIRTFDKYSASNNSMRWFQSPLVFIKRNVLSTQSPYLWSHRVFVCSLTLTLAPSPGSNLYLRVPTPIFIYQLWLIRITNGKSQRLDTMLIFLFFLFNPSVTVIVDRNEAKGNLSKKQIYKCN